MKKLTFILIILATSLQLMAVPAMRGWFTVTQSDGTTLRVRQMGDEHFHYLVTTDNVPLIASDNGDLYYATAMGFGIRSTGIMAHEADQRTDVERAAITDVRAIAAQRQFSTSFLSLPRRPLRADVADSVAVDTTTADSVVADTAVVDTTVVDTAVVQPAVDSTMMGKRRALLLLVDFANLSFRADSTALDFYTHLCNDSAWDYNYRYSGRQYKAGGSVHDYFYDQSRGKFDLSFDVVKVTLDKNNTWYGANSGGTYGGGEDQYDRIGEMVVNACQQADTLAPNLDWKQYDWNGDGTAELVFLLYAGTGEASGGNANTVWPHKFSLDEINEYYRAYGSYGSQPHFEFTSHDSVRVNVYACSNELYGSTSSTLKMGIGTICHEFSHCMGLPDMYDTNNSGYGDGNSNLGDFDILAGGSYNSPENSNLCWNPAGYSAYERKSMNWIDYVTLDSTVANIHVDSLAAMADSGNAYVLYNDGHPDEYFIVENRVQKGWDAQIPEQGLTMMHIDYDPYVWEINMVNTVYRGYNSHARIAFVPSRSGYYGASYTFPYTQNLNNVDSITDNSNTPPVLYNNNKQGTRKLGLPIYNITFDAASGLASFVFMPIDTTHTDTTTIDSTKTDSTMTDSTMTAIRNIAVAGSSVAGVYTLDGTLVASGPSSQAAMRRRGIYVVRFDDGRTRKVVVR